MQRYVMEQNIKRFHELLDTDLEFDLRGHVERLLAEEKTKLEGYDAANPPAGYGARRPYPAVPRAGRGLDN